MAGAEAELPVSVPAAGGTLTGIPQGVVDTGASIPGPG